VKRLAVIGALAGLCAAGSGVGMSSATFTAHDSFSASITTAADWVAPALTLTSPADGSYQKTTSVTVSGAAGNASGDSATVTVDLYSGSTATGTPVQTHAVTRNAATWSSSFTSLAEGTYTLLATQSDGAGNTATSAASTFTVDTTAPTRVSIAAANGTGTSGHLDAGDTITYTFSEPMLASSVLSGWSGAGAATVKVRFFKVSSSLDGFTVLDSNSAANVKLDNGSTSTAGVTLGSNADFVSGTVTFSATLSRSADGQSFVVTLASPDANASRVNSTRAIGANMTWTPKAGPTDLAGNALTNTNTYTETGSGRDF
jgi:hypothetical protein